MNTLTIANFVPTVRNAILALDCSVERARNLVNSELGKVKLNKTGEVKQGRVSYKETKKGDVVTGSIKPGSLQYRELLKETSIPLKFAAFNYAVAELERLSPTIEIKLSGEFALWLKDKCSAPVKDQEEVKQ